MPHTASSVTLPFSSRSDAAAPDTLAGWVALFDPGQLPILASTAADIELMRNNEDACDASLMADTLAADPLMTLKLLAHVGSLRLGREGSDVETVTAALVMLGISPFFRTFGPQRAVESELADVPWALSGFNAVLRRSRRAARFAIGFAVHRLDHDAAVIHEAALLHDFTEMLLWLYAPALAATIADRQLADSTLRSSAIQHELLNIGLDELEHALMLAWHLPALLIQITDEHDPAPTPQVRNVQLAIRLARHSAKGWDNAALPDDFADIGQLLNLSLDSVERLVHEIDADTL